MAINFPDSPSNGDTHVVGSKTFVYNSTTTSWSVQSGASVDLTAISSNILPDTDSAYDLGSATNKFRSLYLSGSTLFLGDSSSISAGTGGEIILPSIKIGTGDNAVKLEADASGKLKTKKIISGVTQAAEEPGNATVVTDMAGLIALTGMSTGKIALVSALNKMFVYTGSAWYLIATVTNSSPTDITGVNATYDLATDGTATTITAVSTDPEGFPLTWSYAVTTGSLGSTATVSQADNVFTITPSTTEADAGTFSITFSVTDGETGAVSVVSAFTLAFYIAPASSVFFEPSTYGGTGGTTDFAWVVPAGVSNISVCVIGAGGAGTASAAANASNNYSGAGGGGGGLAYRNNIPVTAGETLTVKVADGTNNTSTYSNNMQALSGAASEILRGATVLAKATGGAGGTNNGNTFTDAAGGTGSGLGITGQVGFTGGAGGRRGGTGSGMDYPGGGGGGAAGYSGDGGRGGYGNGGYVNGLAGSGGGGGGGAAISGAYQNTYPWNGGGGTGPWGSQAWVSGAGGLANATGAGGTYASTYSTSVMASSGSGGSAPSVVGWGGKFGGGGGAGDGGSGVDGRNGWKGVVRIMWGAGREYPATNASNNYNVDAETAP